MEFAPFVVHDFGNGAVRMKAPPIALSLPFGERTFQPTHPSSIPADGWAMLELFGVCRAPPEMPVAKEGPRWAFASRALGAYLRAREICSAIWCGLTQHPRAMRTRRKGALG